MQTIENTSFYDEAIQNCENQVKAYAENIEWLKANKQWINEVGLAPSFSGNSTFFHNANHDQVIQVIRIIRETGGKYNKTYNATSVTYKKTDSDRWIYLCDSHPPGSCRMVPVVETIAAHWEPEKIVNTFKLQCREEDEPGTADVEIPDELTAAEEAYREVITVRGGEEI